MRTAPTGEHRAPPWHGDPSAIVVVDWSWWTHKAFALFELSGMVGAVVGWLTDVLAYEPAHLVIALDSTGPTFRHRMQHPTDPEWTYKKGRDPKPDEFFALAARCTELAELHSIPVLWAEGFEADDVIATVATKARALGYRAVLCTADKDLHGLVEADDASGPLVYVWDNFTGEARGPAEVRAKFGVGPAQIADWLAITGDAGDNVPGVDGIGAKRAAALLARHYSLDAALSTPLDSFEVEAEREARIKDAARLIKKSAPGVGAKILERAAEMTIRAIEKDRAKLHASADVARFSRSLTALDCDAPIDVPWHDAAIGGYQVDALVRRYESLGFLAKARAVAGATSPKRPPWALPW